jgi:hypothetical protein
MNKYPEAASVVKHVYKVFSDIEILAKCTPAKVRESSDWITIVSIAEENSKLLQNCRREAAFSALYGIYTLILNELKAVLKVIPHAGQSGAVTKISLESAAHDDEFQEVKRRKRYISNDTSQRHKKSTMSAPKSSAGKQPTKAMITRNVFAPLITNDMDTETIGAETTLPEEDPENQVGRHQ